MKDIMVEVSGIKHPRVIIKGSKDKNIKVKVDNKEYKLQEDVILDNQYVRDLILNQESSSIYKYVDIPKNSKLLEVYVNNKLYIIKEVGLQKRMGVKITYISKVFKRSPRIIKKVVKIMWNRHHFIVPPRLMKKYFASFKNNMSNKNIEELSYNPLDTDDYNRWLEEQNTDISYKKLKYQPLISIIIPTYNVSKKLLEECIESVLHQSYDNYEICIADDKSTHQETLETLKKYEQNKKIHITYRQENGHISAASNTALQLASGEFIALLDNDDILVKDALYYMVECLNEDKDLDLIYSDEDKLDESGRRTCPHFKPDFAPSTLLSSNYICHFTMIRKKIVDDIGGFRSEYNGAQDYDLFLRIIEKTKKIKHLSKILYHWRITETSTAGASDHKNYAYLAGQKALEDYFKRNKIKAKVDLIGTPAMYDVTYLYEKEPKISIIIPTKDRSDILDKCLTSIYNNTIYHNYEVIVVSNNSEEEKTLTLLHDYQQKHNNFSYMEINEEFNYSYLNNEMVKKSKGEYIVLLNNDIEIISSNWLSKMVGYAMQEHIGCVGIKLLYPNLTIQHAGVIVGCGVAGHAYLGTGEDDYGYFGRLVSPTNCSVVTAACLMVKKSKYNLVNGLDEKLKVAYNDVDFNLKLLDKGYYNVIIPNVKAIHYESLTRGSDISYEKKQRFIGEIKYMVDKWGKRLLDDRFYNSNLSYDYLFRLDKKDGGND